jgi:cobaltochelatase CobS
MDYLDKVDEITLLQNHTSLNKTIVTGMVEVANLCRSAFRNQKINSTISVRGLLDWAHKIEHIGDIGKAFAISWVDKIGTDDKGPVKDIFFQVFSRKLEV